MDDTDTDDDCVMNSYWRTGDTAEFQDIFAKTLEYAEDRAQPQNLKHNKLSSFEDLCAAVPQISVKRSRASSDFHGPGTIVLVLKYDEGDLTKPFTDIAERLQRYLHVADRKESNTFWEDSNDDYYSRPEWTITQQCYDGEWSCYCNGKKCSGPKIQVQLQIFFSGFFACSCCNADVGNDFNVELVVPQAVWESPAGQTLKDICDKKVPFMPSWCAGVE